MAEQDDRDVTFITLGEVKAKIRRLKAGGAPGPDGVTKGGILQNRGIAEVLTALLTSRSSGSIPHRERPSLSAFSST